MWRLGEKGQLAQMTVLMAVGLFSMTHMAQAFDCPNPSEVSPCNCSLSGSGDVTNIVMRCDGSGVTQSVLTRVATATRRVNNEILEISLLSLTFTSLVEIDWRQFEGGTLTSLQINDNSRLSRVFCPDLNSTNWQPIISRDMSWKNNYFSDQGLQTMFTCFSGSEISSINLSNSMLTGSLGREIIPGFSQLPNVALLVLDTNNNRVLRGGHFQRMGKLSGISIYNNGLEEIGEGAFVIDEAPAPGAPSTIILGLVKNSLSDESFHPSSGITNTKRTTQLFLSDNNFTTVRANPFEDFLDTDPGNYLNFERNPIFCAPEMKWLKDRRQEFQNRVAGLNCANDPGKTVFTSCLVSECPTTTTTSTTTTTRPTTTTTTTTTTTVAPCTGFECTITGNCLPLELRCDGKFDCGPEDLSDEEECPATTTPTTTTPFCRDGLVPCPEGGWCIEQWWRCDGVRDCPFGGDEENCPF